MNPPSDKHIHTKTPIIVGPTAVGKTAVAVQVCDALNGEIISADSRQIYEGMAIGTGAPSGDELARVRHHLVGVIPPERRLSAGEFAGMAREAIDEVRGRGRLPVVVGGAGLYVRALWEGLAEIPSADPELRAELDAEVTHRGMRDMIVELRSVDPEYAEKVGENDRKRLIRALEVWRATGKSITEWHRDQDEQGALDAVPIGLKRPRQSLWKAIEKRVKTMIEAGWVDEVRTLAGRSGEYDRLPLAVTEGLGYKEILEFLRGRIDMNYAVERVVISTRQFAKRQMTWFNADKRIKWHELPDEDDGGRCVGEIVDYIRNKINT